MSQAAFAAKAGVALPSFRYWLYKLRAAVATSASRATAPQASRGRAGGDEVRLVPVQVRGALEPQEPAVEVDVATLRLCVRGRADPRYVALLVGALREIRC